MVGKEGILRFEDHEVVTVHSQSFTGICGVVEVAYSGDNRHISIVVFTEMIGSLQQSQ